MCDFRSNMCSLNIYISLVALIFKRTHRFDELSTSIVLPLNGLTFDQKMTNCDIIVATLWLFMGKIMHSNHSCKAKVEYVTGAVA